MNAAQREALDALVWALHAATDTGLFDRLSGDVMHPDIINAFCDAITEVRENST